MTVGTLLVLLAGGASWFLTGLVRRYALGRSLLDVPNHRSSHLVPTPRGGGLAILTVHLVGAIVALAAGWIPLSVTAALVGGGVLVGGIGFIDDHRSVPARVRFFVHLTGAAWALFCLGGLPSLRIGDTVAQLGLAGTLLAGVGVVWCVNLYNFMDGIDGLAASEAVVVGLAGGVLLLLAGDRALASLSFLLAAASSGFLAWNWQPARIFMGDIGSGFLGYAFAVLALASERRGSMPLLGWILLLGVFFFDATATLLRRVLHGQKWYDAHRTHAYQRAVQSGWSAASVSATVIGIDLVLALLTLYGLLRAEHLVLTSVTVAVVLGIAYLAVERVNPMRRPRQSDSHPELPGGRA